ncbi:ribosome maturation factor RimM [Iamia sp.]|uniref:ribosome maturation factor RimM n=1 Tax=Iamia sp. TaxID=2722710 RepID=UPI002B98CB85|nr:ribosome maturation factor RimM [Iamia sp.]HXH56709.1 ribosome maturation factor RimM [Iamia sp.]
MAPPAELLEVGRIDKAHGLRGDVIVTLTTDRTERLDPGSRLWVGDDELEVVASTRHQHRWIVDFVGLNSREDADARRGSALHAEPLDASDGALWVHELVDAAVVLPDGTEVGTVSAVQDNPAHELLVLDTGALVPVVFVSDASGLPDQVVIDPPDGLLDADLLGR